MQLTPKQTAILRKLSGGGNMHMGNFPANAARQLIEMGLLRSVDVSYVEITEDGRKVLTATPTV